MSWRLQRQPSITPMMVFATRVVSVILALLVGGAALAASGYHVGQLAMDALTSSFANSYGIQDLGLLVSPLILTGLAAAVTLRIGLWNIGAEGQFYAGAVAATAVGLYIQGTTPEMLVLMAIAGFIGGAVWILVPALARAYLEVSEIITSLLLNFVATLAVYWLCTGPWRDPKDPVTSASPVIPYNVPTLDGDLHWGIVAGIVLVVMVALVLAYTKWGYEVRLAGANRHAAHYAGVPVRRRLIEVMLLSGGLAGFAGMLEVAGTVHHLQAGMSNNFGYLGILVAVLAGAVPVAVLASGLFMAVILNAGIVLQTEGMNTYQVLALTGLILFFIAIGEQIAYWRVVAVAEAR